MNLLLERCRLFCFDKWGECCKKNPGKSTLKTRFWVKLEGLFWKRLYKRVSYEEWMGLYNELQQNSR